MQLFLFWSRDDLMRDENGFTDFEYGRVPFPGSVPMFGYLCDMPPGLELDLDWVITQKAPLPYVSGLKSERPSRF